MQNTKLLESFQKNRRHEFRLFCFHYAGGSAGLFSDWHRDLPAWLDICPVQLPGRGLRYKEPPISNLDTLTSDLLAGLSGHFEGVPYAFLGYSMGALIAYDLSRKLAEAGMCLPKRLFVAAQKAPTIPSLKPFWHDLGKREMIAKLRTLGGTSEEALASSTLIDMLYVILKADFALVETYRHATAPPLSVPITAFCGEEDWLSTRAKMLAWEGLTKAGFDLQMIPGGHFFIQSHRNVFLAKLSAALSGLETEKGLPRGEQAAVPVK